MPSYTVLYTRTAAPSVRRQRLDHQEAEGRAYAARHRMAVSEVIREASDAYRSPRPRFEAMIRHAEQRQQRGIQVRILCSSPDRLTRQAEDWLRLDALCATGVELHFVHGGARQRQSRLTWRWYPIFEDEPPGCAG
jgi:DNA invertase Pin-like site-specific DNA recombinase